MYLFVCVELSSTREEDSSPQSNYSHSFSRQETRCLDVHTLEISDIQYMIKRWREQKTSIRMLTTYWLALNTVKTVESKRAALCKRKHRRQDGSGASRASRPLHLPGAPLLRLGPTISSVPENSYGLLGQPIIGDERLVSVGLGVCADTQSKPNKLNLPLFPKHFAHETQWWQSKQPGPIHFVCRCKKKKKISKVHTLCL